MPLLRLTATKAPIVPRGLSHPPRVSLPARPESLESGGAFSPSRPLWTGQQARGPLEWGEAWVGRWAERHQLCVTLWEGLSPQGTPTPALGGRLGRCGVGGGLEVVSLGTEGTVLSSCAEAHPASPSTHGDRLLPQAFVSYVAHTHVCSKGHTGKQKSSVEMKAPLIQARHL